MCVWLCMSSGMLGTVNFGEVRKRRNKKKKNNNSINLQWKFVVGMLCILLLFFVVFLCFIVTYSSDKLVCPWCGQSVFVQFYLIIYIFSVVLGIPFQRQSLSWSQTVREIKHVFFLFLSQNFKFSFSFLIFLFQD